MNEPPDAAIQLAGLIFAVLLLDGRGTIVQANPAAENLFGQSEKRLAGKEAFALLNFENDRFRQQFHAGEVRLIARSVAAEVNDRRMSVNLTISPVGTYPSWYVMTISENIGNETGYAAEDRSLIGAPNILGHEIKNPLSAIRGAAQLLARKIGPGEKKLSDIITREVDRIADIIDRMQQLGSRGALDTRPSNLHGIVRNAIATVRAARSNATEADAVIVEEFDPSLPPVLADAATLEQVLINVLVNACDATMESQDKTVVVQTRYASGLSFKAIRFGRAVRLPIEIAVIDRGAGIAPEIAERVFDPFVSSKPKGQGLGLALARKLVEDMQGRISHTRDEKRGETSFRIHLPMAE